MTENRIGQAFSAERSISQPSKPKKEKPTPIQDEVTLRDIRAAAREAVVRCHDLWIQEKEAMDAAVEEACKNDTLLPPNYWQKEHHAHGLYINARNLWEALQ